jgi:hypothetical protein
MERSRIKPARSRAVRAGLMRIAAGSCPALRPDEPDETIPDTRTGTPNGVAVLSRVGDAADSRGHGIDAPAAATAACSRGAVDALRSGDES